MSGEVTNCAKAHFSKTEIFLEIEAKQVDREEQYDSWFYPMYDF